MVWSRTAAVNYLKDATLCNGLVLEYRGMAAREGKQHIYIMNQCGLTATALKQVGDSTWMLIRDMMRQYLERYNVYGASLLRNYLYPIINPAVVPLSRAFQPNNQMEVYVVPGGTTDDNVPSKIIIHQEAVDNLSDVCGNEPTNRGFMRALYHWQQGQTSTANTCYDAIIAERPESWHIADDPDDFVPAAEGQAEYVDVWKYKTYKQILQWICAKGMGRTRLYTDVLDVMQDPTHGGVRTFYKTNYSFVDDDHNTETTAMAIIADLLWNPP